MKEIKDIALEIAELVAVKDENYNSAFDTAVDRFGHTYYLSKLFEKYSRLEFMEMNNIDNEEGVEDSLRDLIGYALLTLRRKQGVK